MKRERTTEKEETDERTKKAGASLNIWLEVLEQKRVRLDPFAWLTGARNVCLSDSGVGIPGIFIGYFGSFRLSWSSQAVMTFERF